MTTSLPESRGVTRAGSALLLTILTVSILLLISLTLVAMVRLELRGVENHLKLLQARANARLGAEMAMARLQEWTGPDQRVTVRADMWDGTVANRSRPTTVHPAGKRRWVGVWDSRSFNETAPTAKTFLGWLVSSGNPTLGLAENEAPPGATDPNAVTLVGPGSVSNAADHLRGRLVKWANDTQAYAWMVDDNGLKAQLAAQVRNDLPGDPPGGGVIPGAYPLDNLPGLGGMAGVSPGQYPRLNSTRDLPFLGAQASVVPDRFYDYTTLSRGVLADVKHGGLKKDLTIAFENDTVFTEVFPTSRPLDYFLLDADKQSAATDLMQTGKGYIHWAMFRDYYNTKRYIFNRDGVDVLDFQVFEKQGLASGTQAISLGTLAPHAMGGALANGSRHPEMPYGDLNVFQFARPYKHHHMGFILSAFKQNAWMELLPSPADGGLQQIRTHVQLWSVFYNPYNIGLISRGRSGSATGNQAGPRLHNYPQVYFHVPEIQEFATEPGRTALSTGVREMHDTNYLVTRPGMGQVYGFKQSRGAGSEINQAIFSQYIRDVVLQSVDTTHDLAVRPSGDVTLNITYAFAHKDLGGDTSRGAPNIMHGTDRQGFGSDGSGDQEINQVLYAPFAWDQLSGYPAKRITRTLATDELNENTMLSAGFALRTTRETPNALRPLIDANIRAMWANPRWDSPLGLSNLAAYTPDNEGEMPVDLEMETNAAGQGFAYWGAGRDPSDGSTRVILFDIPRADLVSLGQLQHAGAGRFSYEPSYIVGNSYANPRLPLNDWRTSTTDTFSVNHQLTHRISGSFNLYDASYLVNQRMWDRFVFTTLPQMDDNTPASPPPSLPSPPLPPTPAKPDYPSLLARDTLLPNPRFLPYQPLGLAFSTNNLMASVQVAGAPISFHHNAGFLMVDGAFNVNSTSVDAWEAFLSGTLELPVQRVDADGKISGFTPGNPDRIRFPRVKASFGEGMDTDSLDENYWTGFRALKQSEVRALAAAIVREVKSRGPFLNMAEFVNRSLANSALGHAGPLQAALDATVNKGLDTDFERDATASPGDSTQGAGFPGQLLQGDILQALSPLMSVRSDTFTIRSYGELKAPGGTQTEAKAWCELVVQRLPDPVLNAPTALPRANLLAELAAPSSTWGRRFQVISFRWLAEDEI